MMRFMIIISLYLTLPIAVAGGDPAQGKSKAIICIGCHGIDGNNTNSIYPILAGQTEAYLSKQLNDFKTGKRQEEHMSSMVEAITTSDIPDVASYFAMQKRKQLIISKKDNTDGKWIYLKGVSSRSIPSCVTCHNNIDLSSSKTPYPTLDSQHSDYIQKALKEFRSETRHNDINKTMRNIAVKLTDKEIKAVADYIATIDVKR